MSLATYNVEIDTLRDAAFAGSIDDVTIYVMEMRWNNGMADPYGEVAPSAKASIKLDNREGQFDLETVGAELVTNGNFATWSGGNPTGWTVTGEVTTNPEVSQVSVNNAHGEGGTGACNIYTTSAAISITQTILTVGQSYRLTFNVTNFESGLGIQAFNGSTEISPILQAVGMYTYYFTATATTLKFQNYGAIDVTLDDVSCVQTSLYGNLVREGTQVRIQATFSAVTYTMFVGQIVSVDHQIGSLSERYITITAQDIMWDMLKATYNPPLKRDVRVDEAIADLFDKAVLPYPYPQVYWMLGVSGASELGVSTYVYTHAVTTFDAADTTLAFTGDTSGGTSGTDPQTFIRDMVAAEAGGRFYFDVRTGKFIFHRRNKDLLNTTVAATFTENELELGMCQYVKGKDIVNKCTVNYTPREEGAVGTILWTATNVPFDLKPGEVYKVTAQYTDADNPSAKVAALDDIPITNNVDLVAVTTSGTTAYSRLAVSEVVGASSVQITITNKPDRPRTMRITTLQKRGTPLTTFDNKSVVSVDADSVRDFKNREETLTVAAIDNEDLAQSYADYRVAKFARPIPRFVAIGVTANTNDTTMLQALSRVIGERITVTIGALNHDQDYVIVGEEHNVKAGGDVKHTTKWTVKPSGREIFWVLGTAGFSELGETTRVAF